MISPPLSLPGQSPRGPWLLSLPLRGGASGITLSSREESETQRREVTSAVTRTLPSLTKLRSLGRKALQLSENSYWHGFGVTMSLRFQMCFPLSTCDPLSTQSGWQELCKDLDPPGSSHHGQPRPPLVATPTAVATWGRRKVDPAWPPWTLLSHAKQKRNPVPDNSHLVLMLI